MAEARFSQDELTCPVCLDLLKDPVSIQCGHSYCKSCITSCWDREDQMRVYSCPQCRQIFSPRPALGKNTMLAELVEKLKKTKLPADCDAGAGDVQCDVCTGRKYKAVKSCLVCLNSYCQNHLEQHESFFKGKRHNLIDATGRLQEMICQKHEKVLEVFCRTDQKCICVLCTMDEHKNHDTVSAAAQRTEKQKQLKETQKTFQQRIQQREKDVQQLRETVESHKRSAQTAVEDSERIFTELNCSIERSRSELIRLIRDQEKTAVSRAEEQLERLEQEINDLRRRDDELEQLSHTQDHIQFLQSFQSLSAPPESTDVNDDPFSSRFSYVGLRESVHQLRDKLEDFCKEELKKISDRVTSTNIVPSVRNDFLQCKSGLEAFEKKYDEYGYGSVRPLHATGPFLRIPLPDPLCGLQILGNISPPKLVSVDPPISPRAWSFTPSQDLEMTLVASLSAERVLSEHHPLAGFEWTTLDLNTVNKHLCLSKSNREITHTDTVQSYPDHPDRFDSYSQVLWSSRLLGGVDISVSYKSMSKKGLDDECVFGCNDQSWSLYCSPFRYSFGHDNIWTDLTVESISSRIGVRLSFTSLSSTFMDISLTISCCKVMPSRKVGCRGFVATATARLLKGWDSEDWPSNKLKMTEARLSQDELMCSVCLDLLKDPVSIQCGHSYCKSCITDCWDREDQMRVYSCPQCRQTFSPRPALATNTILAELVEKLKKRKRPADCDAGAGDVQCDVCTGTEHKAVKSCLVCQEFYCQTHFDRHEEFHSRKPHKVIDATGRLQEMICQKHGKHLEMYCITDQQYICQLCKEYEHKNHNTVSGAAQRTEKQKQLKERQKTFQQRIQQREKDVQQLRETVESHKRSAQTAVEDSERIFTELIRSIERSRSELIRLIRDQEKTAVSRAEERLERLEQEINDLRRRDAELEQLSHTQDHIQFLQSFQSLSAPPESTDINYDPFISLIFFDDLKESVHQLRDKLEDFCKEELKKISDRVTSTNIVPRTRNDFLQYSHQLTLDLNTVNKHLRLSESNRVLTHNKTVHSYPDNPERFENWPQVLCRESVCGRCYWELEYSAGISGSVDISVSYKSISRKGQGDECVFGRNDQSWCLYCTPTEYSFGHNNKWTDLPVKSVSSRIGVYVDHSAGTLSFYSVSDTMSLIHTVQTTFTQLLYPGFWVRSGSSVKLFQ
ncbi:uncharacterized protein [Garra rufa]|uniref:uncharacterized protein n=1 Tax=Garra rufa TaxID=137080 RepID=UPI003CCE90CD